MKRSLLLFIYIIIIIIIIHILVIFASVSLIRPLSIRFYCQFDLNVLHTMVNIENANFFFICDTF